MKECNNECEMYPMTEGCIECVNYKVLQLVNKIVAEIQKGKLANEKILQQINDKEWEQQDRLNERFKNRKPLADNPDADIIPEPSIDD